jgi:aspartate racemase
MIGILAGMGPRSTAPFIELVVAECQRQYGAKEDIDFPKMMICSQPAPIYTDRPLDHAALSKAIRDGLQHLERTGADFLAIACNTAHIYYAQLSRSVNVPLLNMVDLAVAQLPETSRSVAVIATRATVQARIYQEAVEQRGFKLATSSWQDEVDRLITASRTSQDVAMIARLWREVLERIEASNVDSAVVACSDLNLRHAVTPVRLVDASLALAAEIVREWRSRVTHSDM